MIHDCTHLWMMRSWNPTSSITSIRCKDKHLNKWVNYIRVTNAQDSEEVLREDGHYNDSFFRPSVLLKRSADRIDCTLLDKLRSMLGHSISNGNVWGEPFFHAADLHIRTDTTS